MITLIQILFLFAGLVLLVKGADWFVDGAIGIAERLRIPHMVIGMTVVAAGTSVPEAAVSITCARSGKMSMALGMIIGSNILNVLFVLGIAAMLGTLVVQTSTVRYEIPFLIFMTGVFLFLGYQGKELSRTAGVILLAAFVLYIAYLVYRAKKDGNDVEFSQPESNSGLRHILFSCGGIIFILAGSQMMESAAEIIAKDLNLDSHLIALTVVAMATSLPELFTTSMAVKRGRTEMAIGNVVGSNLFNLLAVMGGTSLFVPIRFESFFVTDALVALGACVLLWIFLLPKKKLHFQEGAVMLLCYVAYAIFRFTGTI